MSASAQRNTTIDLAKFTASLLIIGIHANIGSDINNTFGFLIVDILCRLAVPFYAVSTGYFLASVWGGERVNKTLLLRQENKLIKLYFIWSALYLLYSIPWWLHEGWFSPWAFVDYAIGAVKNGAHYHLWYILGLFYALPVMFFLLVICKTRLKVLLLLSISLYVVMLLFYSYDWILPYGGGRLHQLLSISFPATAALFLILPMLLLGFCIGNTPVLSKRIANIGFILSFLMLCTEAFFLKARGYIKVSYIVFSYPTAYFLFQALLNIRSDSKLFTKLAGISVYIYCFHPMVVETVGKTTNNSIVLFLITVVISIFTGWGFIEIKRRIERKRLSFH